MLVSKVGNRSRGRPEGSFFTTTPRCRGKRYSFPRISPLYLSYGPYNAKC